jgi:hypothetical protein
MWLRYDTALPRTPMLQAPLIALTLLASCGGGGETAEPFEEPAWRSYDPPAVETPPASLKRLTAEQYQSALTALFGESLILPTSLEPDEPVDGLRVVGASVTSLSSRGVEQYEEAALNVAAQLVESPELQAALVRCEPAATRDDACAAEALEDLAWRAWRRPVEGGELEVLVDLAGRGADTLGDFYEGLTFAVAAVLQSPWFLYRVELGEPDPLDPSRWRYTDYEMASRLAWFLWNTLPDDALLAAAEAGALTGDEGLAEQVDRMLADPRARDGVRSFFTDAWLLYELDALSKDPDVFPNMSELVGPSAREETLLGLEHLIFEEQGDWRDALTSQRTFVDRTLAAIYDVPAPTMDGFGEIRLEESGGRRGLLGQVSVLGLHSHAVSTSVTRRGIFVRQVLLCQTIPSPPADVDTSIPEADADAPTMRDRVASHLEDPTCAACHQITDPIGLGLENFDGLGLWRDTENDVTIDASGDLDGAAFADAWELAGAVREHSSLVPCMVETLYRYANGRSIDPGEDALVDWHTQGFEVAEYRVQSLLRDIALGPGFRTLAPGATQWEVQ